MIIVLLSEANAAHFDQPFLKGCCATSAFLSYLFMKINVIQDYA